MKQPTPLFEAGVQNIIVLYYGEAGDSFPTGDLFFL
jgi:hypothetical protein